MNAAGHFSRRKEAGNRISLCVEHFRLRIDFDTAHRVVYGRSDFDRVVRSLRQIALQAVRIAVEVGIFFIVHIAGVCFQRLFKLCRRYAELLRKLRGRRGFGQ